MTVGACGATVSKAAGWALFIALEEGGGGAESPRCDGCWLALMSK